MACNKCRSGPRAPGDSWCLGCSSVEALLADLRREWASPTLREAAESSILSTASLVRKLRRASNSEAGQRPAGSEAERAAGAGREADEELPEDEEVYEEDSEEPPPRRSSTGTTPKSQPPKKRPRTPPRPPPGHQSGQGRREEEGHRHRHRAHDPQRKHRGGAKHQQHSRRNSAGDARTTHRPLGRELEGQPVLGRSPPGER